MNTIKTSVLIGDIGGTNSRLSIIKMTDNINDIPEVVHEDNLQSFKYDSLLSICKAYLEQFKGTDNYPKLAVLGVPGPVENNAVLIADSFPELKNTTGKSFGQALNIERFIFLNDFGVNGYGVQSNLIEGVDYVKLNDYPPALTGAKCLIGAGTGLGMGYMNKCSVNKYYDVNSSEGCYQDFPSKNPRQERYVKYSSKYLNVPFINVEHACCGSNLIIIYLFLHEIEQVKGDELLIKEAINAKGNKEEIVKVNKIIISKGMSNECNLCRATLDFFIEIYGQIAGNLACAVLSTGGVYLLGGMSAVLEPYLCSNTIFMDNFIDKGSMKPICTKMPVIIIKNTNLGVRGAAEYARRELESSHQK